MKRPYPLYLLIGLVLITGCSASAPVSPPEIVEHADFAPYFERENVAATFVLFDPASNQYVVHNATRAQERFIPASTFKILHSLIGLETGVVTDTSSVFTWDGTKRSIANWNQDQTLSSAIKYSAVWVYQDIARKIGDDRMKQYVQKAAYGNQDIGGGIDQFWLTGDLRISAIEQVELLQKLHERRLPFKERTMALVEGIMIEESNGDATLRGKSGLANGDIADVGWYVGYVVRADHPTYFALQMDVRESKDIPLRRSIARNILSDMGLL